MLCMTLTSSHLAAVVPAPMQACPEVKRQVGKGALARGQAEQLQADRGRGLRSWRNRYQQCACWTASIWHLAVHSYQELPLAGGCIADDQVLGRRLEAERAQRERQL